MPKDTVKKTFSLRGVFPFLVWFKLVNKTSLKDDAFAGITNAVIVLPQGVAFAMIAGLPPIYGLYTAIVIPFVAALFGSSLHLISGPTTALSIVLFSSLTEFSEAGSPEFIALAFVMTFLAGCIQLLFGIAKLGSLVNFVSHSVIVGFTSGAAVLIATSQLSHVVGIDIPDKGNFIGTLKYISTHLADSNLYVISIALITLFSAVLIKKYFPKFPHMLIAMVFGSVLAYFFSKRIDGIELVGRLPAKLPHFSFPDISFNTIIELSPSAFAIALLGLIEAVAIARAISIKSHQKINGNQEFIGQGLSNIIGSMFMSYVGSGSFTRSGLNYQSGAKTPLSAVFAAIFLALILLFVAPLAAYLPIPAMAGIILLVAYKLIDFPHIKQIAKSSKQELAVLIVTFLATLFLHLEYAIYIGVILSLIFYLQKISKPRVEKLLPSSNSVENAELLEDCPQLKIIRIYGSLFFGAMEHVRQKIDELTDDESTNILIVCNGISLIDIAGAEFLTNKAIQLRKLGGQLYLSGLNNSVSSYMNNGGYTDKFGPENIFIHMDVAISQIYPQLEKNICDDCTIRIFADCNTEIS